MVTWREKERLTSFHLSQLGLRMRVRSPSLVVPLVKKVRGRGGGKRRRGSVERFQLRIG